MNVTYKLFALLLALPVLVACGDESAVKDSPFMGDELITVEQALSDRAICENSRWEERDHPTKDIEYIVQICEYKGSGEYYQAKGIGIDVLAEFHIWRVDQGVEYVQTNIIAKDTNGEQTVYPVTAKHSQSYLFDEILANRYETFEAGTVGDGQKFLPSTQRLRHDMPKI